MALQIEDVELNLDRSLVERTQLGDPAAFEELYHRHHDRLYRFCLYRLHEPHEAEDVVQEAFTRAWTHLPRLEGELRFYAWLRTIAANLCTDVGRRRARTQPSAEVEDPGGVDGGQEKVVEQVDIDLLRQAMARLPERHRLVLELREHQGLSYEQLADRTGTTVGTIESLLWRARQGLRRQFAAVSGEGLLAGVPGLGWILRRGHGLHGRLASRVGLSTPTLTTFSNAVAGVAVGSAVAAALSLSGVGSAGAGHVLVRPAVPAHSTAFTMAGSPTAEGGSGAAGSPTPLVTVASDARPSASTASGSRPRMSFTDPVHTNATAARQEAQADPVHASTPGVAVGVDPRTVYLYVRQLLTDQAPALP